MGVIGVRKVLVGVMGVRQKWGYGGNGIAVRKVKVEGRVGLE